VRGQVDHLLVGLGGLVETAEHIEEQAFAIAGFKGCGVLFAGLANGGEGIFIFALAALDVTDVDEGFDVFRIRLGELLELLQR
jgi:hypothetical protein